MTKRFDLTAKVDGLRVLLPLSFPVSLGMLRRLYPQAVSYCRWGPVRVIGKPVRCRSRRFKTERKRMRNWFSGLSRDSFTWDGTIKEVV